MFEMHGDGKMIPEQTKHEVLEKRVDFMVEFIVAMRKWQIPENVLNVFRIEDREFLYKFCYKVDIEPEPYIKMYDEKTR